MSNNTIFQKFFSAKIIFYPESEEYYDEGYLVGKLQSYFPNAKITVNEKTFDRDEGSSILISLTPDKYDSYYEVECDFEPYVHAVLWLPNGDPGYPEEGGFVYCYEDTREMLNEVMDNDFRAKWDYLIYDEDFQDEKHLLECINDCEMDY